MSRLAKDYLAAKEVVRESLSGNPDASIFLAKAQKNLLLYAIISGYSNKIRIISNDLSVSGNLILSQDGKSIAKILKAQADMIIYSIASRMRDSWSTSGENDIPESRNVLIAQKILGTPYSIKSSNEDLQKHYGDLSRFLTGKSSEKIVKKEKKLLFKAKTSIPLICDFVPKKVLDVLQIEGVGTKSVFLSYFKKRINLSELT